MLFIYFRQKSTRSTLLQSKADTTNIASIQRQSNVFINPKNVSSSMFLAILFLFCSIVLLYLFSTKYNKQTYSFIDLHNISKYKENCTSFKKYTVHNVIWLTQRDCKEFGESRCWFGFNAGLQYL